MNSVGHRSNVGSWTRCSPEDAGFDSAALSVATEFAVSNECEWPRTMYTTDGQYIGTAYLGEPPPLNEVLGPVQPRGPTAGMVIRSGHLIAEWGNIQRPDMTFSVAKSFLAVLVGLAVEDGLIKDINEPVVANPAFNPEARALFAEAQNASITWEHLLHQTSEWSGELWNKPDTIDSNRQTDAGADVDNSLKGSVRERHAAGTYWEYNDVRVNLLSFCLLQVFRRPLEHVLAERIMQPIGASPTWRWAAYANAITMIDGVPMPSVPGGGHWGGGLFISTGELGRFGQLILQNGTWNGRSLISNNWIDQMRQPCPLNENYGYMWWLNTNGKQSKRAPDSVFYAAGAGGNIVWIDQEHDLVVVCRWMAKDKIGLLMDKITDAIKT